MVSPTPGRSSVLTYVSGFPCASEPFSKAGDRFCKWLAAIWLITNHNKGIACGLLAGKETWTGHRIVHRIEFLSFFNI
jgi:hypothetical protein